MRILTLVEATAAGVGRHVADLTRGLLDRGHEVHLVYSDMRSDKVFGEDLCNLGEHPGFRARLIQMRRGLHAQDFLAARSLRRYLGSHGPFDLVHCHSTKAGLVGRIGLMACSVKRLYTPHLFFSMDTTQRSVAKRSAAGCESALARLCDGVVAVSRQEYAHALGLGIPEAKLFLIPHGVETERACQRAEDRDCLRRRWGLRDGEVCIGFVGRLVPFKSPETMLRAFAVLLRDAKAPVRLVMVGDGPLAAVSRCAASELGAAPRVVWLGEQDARSLMHAFDIFALTSDAEAGPLVVLEAVMRGLPVVATSVGLVPEAVSHGLNGFVAPVRDVEAIAGGLRALVNDPTLRENMGRASRVIAQGFSVDRMVERTLDLYHEVTGVPRERRRAQELTAAAGR